MNSLAKKIMIYSLAGMMQVGLCATIIEASPQDIDGLQRIVQLVDRQSQHDKRQRQEKERQEREMWRQNHESERELHERQMRENEQHDNTINESEAGFIGIAIAMQLL